MSRASTQQQQQQIALPGASTPRGPAHLAQLLHFVAKNLLNLNKQMHREASTIARERHCQQALYWLSSGRLDKHGCHGPRRIRQNVANFPLVRSSSISSAMAAYAACVAGEVIPPLLSSESVIMSTLHQSAFLETLTSKSTVISFSWQAMATTTADRAVPLLRLMWQIVNIQNNMLPKIYPLPPTHLLFWYAEHQKK